MSKAAERLAGIRTMREGHFMEEQARQEAEARLAAERRAHYEAKRRAAAVTKVEADSVTEMAPVTKPEPIVTKPLAPVTKLIDSKKEKKKVGRPALLGEPMTAAERALRYRARRRAEREVAERAKLMEGGRDG